MNTKTVATQFAILLGVAFITGVLTWHFADARMNGFEIDDVLKPASVLLDQNARLVASLEKVEGVDSEPAILPAYLALIRKDGVPKHADIGQQIDELIENNTTISALLLRYTPHAKSAAFRVTAAQFNAYASSLRDRWRSVFQVFMAGGNLPAGGPSNPDSFADLLQQESR